MDAYPSEYIGHNYPLILLSGLQETPEEGLDNHNTIGPIIKTNSPLVQTSTKDELLQDFLQFAGKQDEWGGKHMRLPNPVVGYKFRACGREYRFPPRKAEPPSPSLLKRTNSLKGEDESEPDIPPKWVLHSPLSPLTPTSPLYPDGVFDPAWIDKHQEQVPCLLIAFFDFTSDPNRNSLNDNQLKSEIADIRSAITKSEYKTKLAVVLLSDQKISDSPDIEDRLATIRRATGLDPKTGLFFLPPNSSRVEVTSFVSTLLYAVQNQCLEYYRDLTKHARRKKNRGSVPPPTIQPTTNSKAITAYAWGIRYDIKQGVFAEFRQEMESACRHYTSALEALMGSEGIFETTASWSPRWNQGRIISDMMAFRIIRCLLWSRMGTTAAQSWVNYRDRMRELVDRRGKGSENYGWEAWESRWAKLMAQLIQRAEVPTLSMLDSLELTESAATQKTGNTTFMPPEKSIPAAEKIPPWHHLHHPGYWMRLSARNANRRRRYAFKMPEEDRVPPSQSPASAVANRSGTYDVYLAPDPHDEYPVNGQGFDHASDIIERLQLASTSFKERTQNRFDERTRLDIGRELLRKQEFEEGVIILKGLWETCSWREEKWWLPLFELVRTLHECAKGAGDIAVVAATVFELHSPHLRLYRDMSLDLMNCGQSLKKASVRIDNEKPIAALESNSVLSFLDTSFTFSSSHGHVGETCHAQLRVFSQAHPSSASMTFSKITARFMPDRYVLELTHSPNIEAVEHESGISIIDLSDSKTAKHLENGAVIYHAEANLTFHPGRRVVFLVGMDIRDPGEIELENLHFGIETEDFDLDYKTSPNYFSSPNSWYYSTPNGIMQKRLGRSHPWVVEIHPKPPKLEIQIKNVDRTLHTDETIELEFDLDNTEDEAVEPQIDIRLLGKDDAPEISWKTDDTTESTTIDVKKVASLAPGGSKICIAVFKAPPTQTELVLEAKIHYSLPSEPEVPLSRIFTSNFKITSAFEANYNFSPRIHPDIWPSYFSVDKPLPGLLQRWKLATQLASFVDEEVHVKQISIQLDKAPKGLSHSIVNQSAGESFELSPKTMRDHEFILDITRPVIKEHRALTITAHLSITWSRKSTPSSTITTSLPIPSLTLPPLEPRIIATSSQLTNPLLIHLTLTMENPTAHPLTFDITAPSSDSLAFSGPKQQAISLIPFSRQEVEYRLLPLIKGGVWVTFGVKVSDRYFVRDVPVLAGEGVVVADEGGVKWWVD